MKLVYKLSWFVHCTAACRAALPAAHACMVQWTLTTFCCADVRSQSGSGWAAVKSTGQRAASKVNRSSVRQSERGCSRSVQGGRGGWRKSEGGCWGGHSGGRESRGASIFVSFWI